MYVAQIEKIIEYSRNLKLLYVEDNVDAREMTTMILEDFFDSIIVAVDGVDGYEKFQNNDIDLVITDINMPNMNGMEMCKEIRKTNNDIPLIILSAHNEDNFFIESISIGINGYLLKPIDIELLSKLISRVIQKFMYEEQAKANLHLLEIYQEATNNSSIVSKTDTKGSITFVNDAFCKITGYSKEELIGKNHNIVRHPDNPKSIFEDMWHTIKDKKEIWKGLVRNQNKYGKSYYVDSLVMPIVDIEGNIVEYISLRNDVTDIMNPAKQLSNALKSSQGAILIYMKLDKFEMMEDFYANDTLELLQDRVTKYLHKIFSAYYNFDKVYQLGSGEYAFIVDKKEYLEDEKSFVKSMKRYQKLVGEQSIDLDSTEYDVNVLISVVYEKDKMLESAKLGIKHLLKTNKEFLIANHLATIGQAKAKENMKVVDMIKRAISSSKIVSYFQPIIDNQTQEIVKYESLVRLIDDDESVLSPISFLETSKKSHYYAKITDIVLENSFSILRNCSVDVSINLSAVDIEQTSTRTKILNLLEANKESATRVVFELLEDENVKELDTIKQFISDVKEYGVKIAIDDFGAGYSNYERLLEYQPDILKIDGCLIRNIESSSYSISVVKSIVTFAKEQNLQTIAEFIETESIFEIVKELGVDFSQGYYFGKPEPLN